MTCATIVEEATLHLGNERLSPKVNPKPVSQDGKIKENIMTERLLRLGRYILGRLGCTYCGDPGHTFEAT